MPDIETIRAEFPVTRKLAYLNHATIGPLTAAAAEAMKRHVDDVAGNGAVHWRTWIRRDDEGRALLASFIGADPAEIAYIKNTSEGVNIVARGLGLAASDVVATVEGEFAANVAPWLALRDQGVRVHFIPERSGRVRIDDIAAALTPEVRVLAISHVGYLTGFRNDLETIGTICRERNVFLFVDGIQGLGALAVEVHRWHIDALAADGHKWLCAPEGAGILYVSRSAQERVGVVFQGWNSSSRQGRFADYYAPLRSDARRYEPGTLNSVGIAGLLASVETLQRFGIASIEERVLGLASRVAEGVKAKGYTVLGSRERGETSGIVSFSKDGVDALMAERRLRERGIIVGFREGFLRAAPHFYNTSDEVDALASALP